MTGVPNQPKTPQRSVRVPDSVWIKAKKKAKKQSISLSEVVRKALEAYIENGD